MRLETTLRDDDCDLIEKYLRGFVPSSVFDSHAHFLHDKHFAPGKRLAYVEPGQSLGMIQYRAATQQLLPGNTALSSLAFSFPGKDNDRRGADAWLAAELAQTTEDDSLNSNRGLALVSPDDDSEVVAEEVARLKLVGLKPYHLYAQREDTPNASLEEFVPEWMWELCHSINGVLMLHLVRERAIADEGNQSTLRRLCRKYPNCRVVLAHIARSFNYRHAREGLNSVLDLDNVYVDTSAVTETPAFAAALKVLGPRRVLFGTDYPVSHFRARCVAVGVELVYRT